MVLVVLSIKIRVIWFFVLCLWSGQSEFMTLMMVVNLYIGPGFTFEPCSSFFNSHFPVSTLGIDLLSSACLNKLLFLWRPVTEKSSV